VRSLVRLPSRPHPLWRKDDGSLAVTERATGIQMIPVPINVHRARDDGSWAVMGAAIGTPTIRVLISAHRQQKLLRLKLAPLHQRPCFITASDSTEVGSH